MSSRAAGGKTGGPAGAQEKKGTVNAEENRCALYDPKTRTDRKIFFRAFRFAQAEETVDKQGREVRSWRNRKG